MSNFILIILYIIIGYGLQHVKLPIKNLAHILNKFVIYLSLPAMILLTIPSIEFTQESIVPVYIAWGVMIISALIVLLVSKQMNFSKEITGSLMLVSVLTNSSFVGIPLISGYLGNEALPYIIIYDQLGTFLALATYGTFVTAYYASAGEVSFKQIALKVVLFPPFVFLIISLFLSNIEFPTFIHTPLELLAATIVPFALIAVGLQLKFKLPRDELKPFAISLTIKLIIAPIIAILMAKTFGWSGFIVNISILEASMAPMITAAAMASMVGLAPRLSNAIVGYGIAFSFVSSYLVYRFL
ncbi:MAG: Malate permease [uncultured Sulfurovum sp.]|uniref:Malate permease n=1 Tax=uncultured Sulfurovum sp. TaxID=269237 RepID=A0A6S6TSZ9_9BACT|nr:MAG: Malate permease [uncultured Sulfurovum sp.]